MSTKGSNLCAREKGRKKKEGSCPILLESGQIVNDPLPLRNASRSWGEV
jgi:hypothetical protein